MPGIFGILVVTVILTSNVVFAYPMAPKPTSTTGDICTTADNDFKEYRYQENIPYCERNVSGHTKTRIFQLYAIPNRCRHRYTIDHFIPLALGGSNDATNLWPEHKNVKALRPKLENELYYDLFYSRKTRNQAVEIIVQAKMNPGTPPDPSEPAPNPPPLTADYDCDRQDGVTRIAPESVDVVSILVNWLAERAELAAL